MFRMLFLLVRFSSSSSSFFGVLLLPLTFMHCMLVSHKQALIMQAKIIKANYHSLLKKKKQNMKM